MRYKQIRGHRLRITRLDGCGNPVPGPDSVVVTKGFISVEYTANVEEGEPISVPNAAGDICISDTPAPKFTGYGVAVNLCGVDPNALNLLTGQPLVYDGSATPEAVGFRVNSSVNLDNSGFAIELWSGITADACAPGQAQAYGYTLTPFLKGGIIGDFTVENAAVNFNVTGAQTKDGSGWGVGPYNVVTDSDGDVSPLLTPITSTDHLHSQLSFAPLPEETLDGSGALGIVATGATAGAPGTFTPANSYGPADLAALQAATTLTKNPTTAWAANQYVTLRDGSRARWNGTAWAAYTG